MSGSMPNASISSMINQCQFPELLTKQTLVKSFRANAGQFKVIGPLSVASSTAFVVEPEFIFPVKAGQPYVLEGNLLISSAAAGGAKIQLNAPANTTGTSVLAGKSEATGTAAVNATVGLTTGAATSTLNATSLYSNAQITDSLYFQLFIRPGVDDVLTISFAQTTSNATASVLLQGSWMNCVAIGQGTRKSPNSV